MKSGLLLSVVLISAAFLFGGCQSGAYLRSAGSGALAGAALEDTGGENVDSRMMIWSASLDIEVDNVSNALAIASEIASKCGGFAERKSGYSEKRGRATLRVPAKNLKSTLGSLEMLGSVTSRSLSGRDVTEEYIDVDARLKNRMILRDRLQNLLDKAVDVKDVLAIEKELNRVQSDIDSMQGRIKSLKGKVDLATIELDLTRKKILGPLGYLFKGIFWGVEKLFIIRE